MIARTLARDNLQVLGITGSSERDAVGSLEHECSPKAGEGSPCRAARMNPPLSIMLMILYRRRFGEHLLVYDIQPVASML
jgi:hypothetical protein